MDLYALWQSYLETDDATYAGTARVLLAFEELSEAKSLCEKWLEVMEERDPDSKDGQVLIFLSNLRTVPRARLSC